MKPRDFPPTAKKKVARENLSASAKKRTHVQPPGGHVGLWGGMGPGGGGGVAVCELGRGWWRGRGSGQPRVGQGVAYRASGTSSQTVVCIRPLHAKPKFMDLGGNVER